MPIVFLTCQAILRVEHVVDLSPGFKSKRMREYKVPECLKAEVKKQLEEMLANGIIRESTSPMCSPLVCVCHGIDRYGPAVYGLKACDCPRRQ